MKHGRQTRPDHAVPFSLQEERARGAVRALAAPQADPQFQARLREAFVSGRVAAAGPVRAPLRRPAAGRAPRLRRLLPVAVAAAALLVVAGPLLRDPVLNITTVEGTRRILVNGELVDCADLSPIQAALQPGCRILVPDGATVQLASAGRLVLALEGVEFSLPTPPHRWFGGRLDSSVGGQGTLRMATAPGFAGSSYRLRLGNAELLTRGSVFSVSRDEGRIAIQVLDGELQATLPDGSTLTLGPESGALIQGGAFVTVPSDTEEAARLRALRELAVVI